MSLHDNREITDIPGNIDDEYVSSKGIGDLSIDTITIYNMIKDAVVDQIITYEDMTTAIGSDIIKRRSLLTTARRMAIRRDNKVFDCIMNVGVKRMADVQIAKVESVAPAKKMRGISRRSTAKLACINDRNLDNETLIEVNASRSFLGAVMLFAAPTTVKTIQKISDEPVPSGKVFRLFL